MQLSWYVLEFVLKYQNIFLMINDFLAIKSLMCVMTWNIFLQNESFHYVIGEVTDVCGLESIMI